MKKIPILYISGIIGCVSWVIIYLSYRRYLVGISESLNYWAFRLSTLVFYGMQIFSVIIEWRRYELKTRHQRLWAYIILLFSNAYVLFHSFFWLRFLDSPVVGFAIPVWFSSTIISWAVILVLCFLGRHPSVLEGRFTPAIDKFFNTVEQNPNLAEVINTRCKELLCYKPFEVVTVHVVA